MNLIARLLVAPTVGVVLFGLVVYVVPGWLGTPGPDGRNLFELLHFAAQTHARAEQLAARNRAFYRCLLEKGKVTKELRAGKLTLLEAAARFRDVQMSVPEFSWAKFRKMWAADSKEEGCCVAVIDYLRSDLEDEGADPGQVAALEAELNQHRAQGTLRLRQPQGCPGWRCPDPGL